MEQTKEEQEEPSTSVQSESTEVQKNDETENTRHTVDWKTAQAFLESSRKAASLRASSVLLIICSPVVLILLVTAASDQRLSISAEQGAHAGLLTMLVLLIAAVVLFLASKNQTSGYDQLMEGTFGRTDEADAMIRDQRGRYQSRHHKQLASGIALCIASCIPLFAGRKADVSSAFAAGLLASIMLILIAFGLFLIEQTSFINNSYRILLEEGAYSEASKNVNSSFGTYYWAAVAILYFIISFLTTGWNTTWLIWLAALLLYRPLADREKNKEKQN